MTNGPDLVEAYLDELLSRLRGEPSVVRRVLNEAESHLREATDAAVASGATERDAQATAIERFGSAARVAASANRGHPAANAAQLAGALTAAAARLVAVGFIAIGVAALAARALAALTSTGFVFGPPAGVSIAPDRCSHWLSVQPSASTCAQAATLENASDTFQLYLGGAILGLAFLAICFAALALMRRLRHQAAARTRLPEGVVPAIGATVFGSAGVALLGAGVSDAMLSGLWGKGLWYVEATVALAIAAVYAALFVRALAGGARYGRGPRRAA